MEEEKSYNFGTVVTGMRKTLKVEVVNTTTIKQTFTIEQLSKTEHLCASGFSMTPDKSPPICPGKSFMFKLLFQPTFPEHNYCDYFTVHHLFGVQLKICTLGQASGDGYTLSHKALTLTCPSSNKKISKFIEFHNPTSTNHPFVFDVDQTQCPLIIEPLFGDLPPSSSTRIKVTFQPIFEGVYFKRIFCLRMNLEPLILDVTCLYTDDRSHLDKLFQFVKELPQYENNYDMYMSVITTILREHQKPLASLDVNYINMGAMSAFSTDIRMLPFTLTNNSDRAMTFKWSKDSTAVFKLRPECCTVNPGSTKQFQISFRPHSQEYFYSSVFDCMVHWEEVKYYIAAFPLSIGVFGHSFSLNSDGWPAMYQLFPDEYIYLPPYLPPKPVYATILIRRFGCLRLSFNFKPPNVSNFAVKPKQGVIIGNLQIIVVQFLPKIIEEGFYHEKWTLKFNTNNQKHKHVLSFVGSVEKLRLIINNKKPVVFPNTYPGCLTTISVPIRNPTRHTIKYCSEVLIGSDVLDVQQYGEIWPNQTVFNLWSFLPVNKGNFSTQVKFVITHPCHMLVEETLAPVEAESLFVELRAEPTILELKTIKGVQVKSNFELVNVGLVTAHVHLHCDDYNNATLQPASFTLVPGDTIQITITVTPDKIGLSSFSVLCSFRVNSESNILLDKCPGHLVGVSVEMEYPILQVVDLWPYYQGHNFSKLNIWKMLNIELLNNLLENVSCNNLEIVNMKCPSFLSNHTFKVDLLVKNGSDVPMLWEIKQCTSCNCKPVLTQVSFSISKMINFCPHKDQITFEPTNGGIKVQEEKIITLTVRYNVDSCPPIEFDLSLCPESYNELKHAVKLRITRYNIKEEGFVDFYEREYNTDRFLFNMVPLPVESVQPHVQIFWFYNNSNKQISYEVDSSELYGTVFSYVKTNDYVLPHSSGHLLFTFLPLADKIYQAPVNITFGTRNIDLLLSAHGKTNHDKCIIREETKMPSVGYLSRLKPKVFLSTSHIQLNEIQPHGEKQYIFMLNNQSDHYFNFKWSKLRIENTLLVKVVPSGGNLPPHCNSIHRVVCCSLGMLCCVTLNMHCKLINLTENMEFCKKEIINQQKQEQCKEWFTITEKGITYPDCKSFEIVQRLKETEPLVMSVSVTVTSVKGKGVAALPMINKFVDTNPPLMVKNTFIIDVLSKIIWSNLDELVTSDFFKFPSVTYYSQILESENKNPIEEMIERSPPVSKKIAQNIMGDLLYLGLLGAFKLKRQLNFEIPPDWPIKLCPCEQLEKGIYKQSKSSSLFLVSTIGSIGSYDENGMSMRKYSNRNSSV